MLCRLVLFTSHLALLTALVFAATAPSPSTPAKTVELASAPPPTPAPASQPDLFKTDISPLVKQYCIGCHSGPQPPNGIDLSKYPDQPSVIAGSAVWQKVADNIQSMHMPPVGSPQPSAPERAKMVDWVQSTLTTAGCNLNDPGRVTLHRLNRQEYDNTVDDLLGVTLRPSGDFPSDDVGYGFDNIGDVLSMSPLLLEKYLSAAEKLAHAAIITPESRGEVVDFGGHDFKTDQSPQTIAQSGAAELYSNGEEWVSYDFPESGDYVVRVRAYGEQAGPDKVKMAIRLNHTELATYDVPQTEGSPGDYQVKIKVDAGVSTVGAAFLNDYYNAADPDPKNRDRNFFLSRIAIVGPMNMPNPLPASEAKIIPHWPRGRGDYDTCARADLKQFATRAFRRPVTSEELGRLVDIFDRAIARKSSFPRAMQIAVEAVLVSPNFLFRVETDPRPNDPKAGHKLDSYELASRLSYFLWSTMPDDQLSQLAASGKLLNPAVLEAQVDRMLKSPRATALATNFAAQWLELRKLQTSAPDVKRFPDFDDGLRDDMRTETLMYFENIVAQDRSILEFLDSDYTFVNEPLAKHYGIAGVNGLDFRIVHLVDKSRGGVLTQASVLTVTSNPTRTSPVKRGKWVLEQLLGTPPPPPPPGVPQLDDGSHGPVTGTLRQRMEQHRKDPACANCHLRMDPLGFGLENFDAVGRWRTDDETGAPIDSSGVLPDGSSFAGPAQLKGILMSRKEQFVHAFSEKLMTYALGRGLTPADSCYVDKIAKRVDQNGYRFSAVVSGIVESPPFLERRGDGAT